jgi:hypothetical protein
MGPRRQSIEFSRWSVRLAGLEIAKLGSASACVRLLVHFRCLYATAVEKRPSGRCVEPGSFTRVGAHCWSVRVRVSTGHVCVCQRLRWAGVLWLAAWR